MKLGIYFHRNTLVHLGKLYVQGRGCLNYPNNLYCTAPRTSLFRTYENLLSLNSFISVYRNSSSVSFLEYDRLLLLQTPRLRKVPNNY